MQVAVNRPRYFDRASAPTTAMLFNPTPFTVKTRARGDDVTLPPNTMSAVCDRGFLDDAGRETATRMPVTNFMVEHITKEFKWGRLGIVAYREGDSMKEKAAEGLAACLEWWNRQEENVRRKLDTFRSEGGKTMMRLEDIKYYGQDKQWRLKPEIEMIQHRQKEVQSCIDDIDKWVKNVKIVGKAHDDQIMDDYKNHITRQKSQIADKDAEITRLKKELAAAKKPVPKVAPSEESLEVELT